MNIIQHLFMGTCMHDGSMQYLLLLLSIKLKTANVFRHYKSVPLTLLLSWQDVHKTCSRSKSTNFFLLNKWLNVNCSNYMHYLFNIISLVTNNCFQSVHKCIARGTVVLFWNNILFLCIFNVTESREK